MVIRGLGERAVPEKEWPKHLKRTAPLASTLRWEGVASRRALSRAHRVHGANKRAVNTFHIDQAQVTAGRLSGHLLSNG